MVETMGLILLPALILGIALGIWEYIFIHADENFRGSHAMGHALHILPFIVIATFISMNIDFFISLVGSSLPPILTNVFILRGVLVLVVAVKIHTGSAVVAGAKGKGMHESWYHTLIIALAVAVAPYAWMFLAPIAPSWMGGGN
jgi:hypothetical protein